MKYMHIFGCYIFLLYLFILSHALVAGRNLFLNKHSARSSSALLFIIKSKARFRRDVMMNKKLYVHDKAYFDHNINCKNDVKIQKNLIVKKGIVVENGLSVVDMVFADVTLENLSVTDTLIANSDSVFNSAVERTLSATDAVIGCDLNVGCNINMVNSSITDTFGPKVVIGVINQGILDGEPLRFIFDLGPDNTFVGNGAGRLDITTDSSNTGVGNAVLSQGKNVSANTAAGDQSLTGLVSSSFANNVSIGSNTLVNFVGSNSVAVGADVLALQNSGGNNTVIGSGAFPFVVDASSNVIIGEEVAKTATSASNNIMIGSSADLVIDSSGSNTFNIYIGRFAGPDDNTEDNTIRIGGNFQEQTYIAGIYGSTLGGTVAPISINQKGQLGIVGSSQGFKHAIKNMNHESVRLYNLSPVIFSYNDDKTEARHYGLIAEDVVQIFPELVVNDKDGLPLTVRYEMLPVLLLNEVKKQKQSMEYLNEKMEFVEDLYEALEGIEDLNNNIKAFTIACGNLNKQIEDLYVHD